MNGTAVGLVIGLAYGAVLGVMAYRWYARERALLDHRYDHLERHVSHLAKTVHELQPAEVAA